MQSAAVINITLCSFKSRFCFQIHYMLQLPTGFVVSYGKAKVIIYDKVNDKDGFFERWALEMKGTSQQDSSYSQRITLIEVNVGLA